MSTDNVLILGFIITKATVFNLAGLFGGCFPLLHAIITRQKTPLSQKIDLDIEFFFVNALIIPLGALMVTALAVAFDGITSWGAALYLGASLPVLVEKALGSSQSTVDNLTKDQ